MPIYDHKTIEEKWVREWIAKKTFTPEGLRARRNNEEVSERKTEIATDALAMTDNTRSFAIAQDDGGKAQDGGGKIQNGGKKTPFYNLMMFPYPSAEGLHVGNMYAFTGADVYGRYQRMKGNDVFEPIGLDGFGIHSENYAMKVGKHPAKQAKISEERFYNQLSRIGAGYAWDHRLETYDPDYYKWTQWLFAEMFRRGLAYRKKASVNWCPSCKTVLADEQVEDGVCERCKNEVGRKQMEQWFFRITRYADRLLSNIEKIDWPNKIKIAQRQWIGKSKGLSIDFTVEGLSKPIVVWTKFWETVFGTTFLVVAPEHWSIEKLHIPKEHEQAVKDYVASALKKTEQERKAGEGDKTGVFTGVYAVNPVNGEKVPVWVADYVLKDVGTAAVMGVPAHDERDFAFARKFKLPIRKVVDVQVETHSIVMKKSVPENFSEKLEDEGWYTMEFEDFGIGVVVPKGDEQKYIEMVKNSMKDGWYAHADGVFSGIIFKQKSFTTDRADEANEYALSLGISQEQLDWSDADNYMFCHEKGGLLVNSGEFDGMDAWGEGKEKMAEWMIEKGMARWETTYHLRDWLISRQRYWGPPIPMVHCRTCAQRKPKVLIIHGTWGSGDGNWFPWLEEYLSQFGVDVKRPTLPDSKSPDYEKRMSYIKNELGDWIDEDTIVMGHSSGAVTALHIAEWKKVKQIFLIAPVLSVDTEYKNTLSGFFDEKTGQGLYDLYNRQIDDVKLKQNSGPIKVLFADDDPYLPKHSIDDAREKYGYDNVYIIPGGKHLSSNYAHGFWELLQYLPMNEIENAGWHPVADSELPVRLPELSDYKPTGDGLAPLARAGEEFLYTKCPQCGGRAKREVDVSDTFLDSSWYFLRYPSLTSKRSDLSTADEPISAGSRDFLLRSDLERPWDEAITTKWLPVKAYIGGAEHAVLHLLYSRFVWMALQDWGYIPKELGDEPFPFLFSHGLIVKDGAKMSKSRGNVVVPDEYIAKYGADTLRMYLMFLGSYDQGGDFRDSGIAGMHRFLTKVWEVIHKEIEILRQSGFSQKSRSAQDDTADLSSVSAMSSKVESTTSRLQSKLHETIRKMDRDLAAFKYNTAIAALMELFNVWREPGEQMSLADIRLVVKLLAPLAPMMSEELWQRMNRLEEIPYTSGSSHSARSLRDDSSDFDSVSKLSDVSDERDAGQIGTFRSVHLESYPQFDPAKIVSKGVLVVVQVNGKMRGELWLTPDEALTQELVLAKARAAEGVEKWLAPGVKKEIYIPAKGERQAVVNFVV